jgi:hypothetical protein
MPHSHKNEDKNAKENLEAFQEDFLRECGEAVAAGFPPRDEDPQYEADPDKIDASWEEAGQ